MEHKKGEGSDSFLEDYKGKTRGQEIGLTLKTDDRLSDVVTDMGSNPTQAEAEIKDMVDDAVKINGITDNDVKVVIYNNPNDGDESGKPRMGGHKEGTIYINAAHQDGSKEKLAEVITDEMSHYVDYKKGRDYDENRQVISRGYGDDGGKQTRRYVGEEKVTDADRLVFQESLKQHNFSKANQEVAEIEEMENRSFEVIFNEFYYADTGRSADEDWEQIPEKIKDSATYKVANVLTTELSPIGDISRIGLGRDPYMERKLSVKERVKEGITTALLMSGGKLAKAGKKVIDIPVSDGVVDVVDKGSNRADTIDDIYTGMKEEFSRK